MAHTPKQAATKLRQCYDNLFAEFYGMLPVATPRVPWLLFMTPTFFATAELVAPGLGAPPRASPAPSATASAPNPFSIAAGASRPPSNARKAPSSVSSVLAALRRVSRP